MREIKPVRTKVSQEELIKVMSKKPPGIYTIGKMYNFMIANGYEMSQASVRNHIGKIESIGKDNGIELITKIKSSGLVAFEFYHDTARNWKTLDRKREKLTAINRDNMKRCESKAEKKNKIQWGDRLIGKAGTKVTMMGV